MGYSVFPAPTISVPASRSQYTVIINSTQSWTAPTGVTHVDLLLVGGGGGGGSVTGGLNSSGGGGGGGGVVLTSVPVSAGTGYTVTIGGGGAAGSGVASGGIGASTTFGSLATALGGGGGFTSGVSGAPTSAGTGGGYGNNGNSSNAAGGGGGQALSIIPVILANTIGQNSNSFSIGLQGSAGRSADNANYLMGHGYIGYNNLYGAGGGGGTVPNSSRSFGGYNAGNGATHNVLNATAGAANFGGGGGGGTQSNTAAAGGSGICIIKYWA